MITVITDNSTAEIYQNYFVPTQKVCTYLFTMSTKSGALLSVSPTSVNILFTDNLSSFTDGQL